MKNPDLPEMNEVKEVSLKSEGAEEAQQVEQEQQIVVQDKQVGPRLLRPGLQVNRKALHELGEWKKSLIKIIKTQSRLVFDNKGNWSFVLPTTIVKLVWNTTIKERIKYEEAKNAEGAVKRAIEGLRQDVEQFVEANKMAGKEGSEDN